jgi:hypothetical protein
MHYYYLQLKVPTAVMMLVVFWVVTLCGKSKDENNTSLWNAGNHLQDMAKHPRTPQWIITSIAGNLQIQNFESGCYDEHAPNYI